METSSREAVLISMRQLRLNGFDWDGVGGLPLRSDVADTVTDLYELGIADNLPMPTVSLNSDGTLEVLYVDPESDKRLYLTFRCEGVVTYIKMFEDNSTSVEGTIRIDMLDTLTPDDFAELVALFDWLAEE